MSLLDFGVSSLKHAKGRAWGKSTLNHEYQGIFRVFSSYFREFQGLKGIPFQSSLPSSLFPYPSNLHYPLPCFFSDFLAVISRFLSIFPSCQGMSGVSRGKAPSLLWCFHVCFTNKQGQENRGTQEPEELIRNCSFKIILGLLDGGDEGIVQVRYLLLSFTVCVHTLESVEIFSQCPHMGPAEGAKSKKSKCFETC